MSTVESVLEKLEAATAELQTAMEQLDSYPIEVAGQGVYTKRTLKHHWDRAKHLPGIHALFELTASRAGEWVPFADVVQESGLAPVQQRNEHSRMTAVSVKLFGEPRWPIEWWTRRVQDRNTWGVAQNTERHYRMDPAIARWWYEILEEEKGGQGD